MSHTDMLPNFMQKNTGDVGLPKTNLFGEFGLADTANCISVTNIVNYFLGQSCLAISFAFSLPPFSYHISHIVGGRSEEQMSGITTGRVVAVVANKHTFGDRAIEISPSKAMRKDMFTTFPYTESIVSDTVTALPSPAGSRAARHIQSLIQHFVNGMMALVSRNKTIGLSSFNTLPRVSPCGEQRRFATATLTKVGGVKGKLDGGCYTRHCQSFSLRMWLTEIVCCTFKQLSTITNKPQQPIAPPTQKTSDKSSFVAMVYCQSPDCASSGLVHLKVQADSAKPALLGIHSVVVKRCNAKIVAKPSFSAGSKCPPLLLSCQETRLAPVVTSVGSATIAVKLVKRFYNPAIGAGFFEGGYNIQVNTPYPSVGRAEGSLRYASVSLCPYYTTRAG